MDKDNRLKMATTLNSYEGQTLTEAIRGIILEKGISREDAIEIIYNELESNCYKLVDVDPPQNFLRYFFSLYNTYFWIIIIYLGLTYYSIMIMPQVYPYMYLRYGCTLLLTLFIPGYLIIDIIMPSSLQEKLLKIGLGVILNFLLVSITGYILISTIFSYKESSIMATLLSIATIISLIWSMNNYTQRYAHNEK